MIMVNTHCPLNLHMNFPLYFLTSCPSAVLSSPLCPSFPFSPSLPFFPLIPPHTPPSFLLSVSPSPPPIYLHTSFSRPTRLRYETISPFMEYKGAISVMILAKWCFWLPCIEGQQPIHHFFIQNT